MIKKVFGSGFGLIVTLAILSPATAEEPAKSREVKLAEYLSGTQFIGKFTVDGKDDVPKTEAYTIKSCEKLPTPDLYRFVARIKYGKVDQEVPMDLKILWSGNTPVITLDSLWIPGMGTFDARVLIQASAESGRYAGTWQHGEAGGHMFGKIVKSETASSAESAELNGDSGADEKPQP